jgi:hypothetical protein
MVAMDLSSCNRQVSRNPLRLLFGMQCWIDSLDSGVSTSKERYFYGGFVVWFLWDFPCNHKLGREDVTSLRKVGNKTSNLSWLSWYPNTEELNDDSCTYTSCDLKSVRHTSYALQLVRYTRLGEGSRDRAQYYGLVVAERVDNRVTTWSRVWYHEAIWHLKDFRDFKSPPLYLCRIEKILLKWVFGHALCTGHL